MRHLSRATAADLAQAADIIARTAYAEPRPSAPVRPAATGLTQAGKIALSVHTDLAALESEWRQFEQTADCTPFQTFDWLSIWQRHIGTLSGVTPAVVIGRRGGEVAFILPLAVQAGTLARKLTFLGQDLCDYNAPLLAPDFSAHAGRESFARLWANILALLQATPALGHDIVALAKMPAKIGAQDNPLLGLDVRLNPSGAYETALGTNWEQFYTAKRSSATRRRDRTKLKKLGDLGVVKFADPDAQSETDATLEVLMTQKSKSFARMGVPNMFARPGHTNFYRALAAKRGLAHLSRLDVGDTWAAVNLGLMFRDCYYHVLASYDDGEVSRFGPGAAHLRELLRYATERGMKRFDFTIGDEPYKRDWCETEQQLFDYSAAETLRGWPSFALAASWRQVKRTIKQTEWLWNAAQKLRSMVATLRKKPEPAAKPDAE